MTQSFHTRPTRRGYSYILCSSNDSTFKCILEKKKKRKNSRLYKIFQVRIYIYLPISSFCLVQCARFFFFFSCSFSQRFESIDVTFHRLHAVWGFFFFFSFFEISELSYHIPFESYLTRNVICLFVININIFFLIS